MDVLSFWQDAKEKGVLRKQPEAAFDDLCPACRKNRRVYCPHKPLLAIKAEIASSLNKQDFFGPSPPNLFVGEFGYPNIGWGPMVSLQEDIPDNPREWYGWNFGQIIRARSMQIRGNVKNSVYSASSPGFGRSSSAPKILLDSQEAAMSEASVDLEMHFSKKPNLYIELNSVHQPIGPSAPLEKMALAQNPKIPKKVDELVDEGVKANLAIAELSSSGFDEHYLTRLLTAGVLGRKQHRVLVPTKWGITAIDDMLAKGHIEKIREFMQGEGFLLYFNEYLANRFSILLLPGAWEYEGFEAGVGMRERHAISVEREPFFGRTEYAKRQGGGYYAARLGVAEALANQIKKQYRALVIREIMPEYDLPCGVWEIRENVRHAMQNHPKNFGSLKDALAGLQQQLKLPLSLYLEDSNILRQSRLSDY